MTQRPLTPQTKDPLGLIHERAELFGMCLPLSVVRTLHRDQLSEECWSLHEASFEKW